MIMKVFVVLLAFLVVRSQALDVVEIRKFAAKNNVSCIYVFGDSSVDPGNNNNLKTDQKVNFLPYGKDFYDGRPTGRFTNGRLATDLIGTYQYFLWYVRSLDHLFLNLLIVYFIWFFVFVFVADALGHTKTIPAYLDPNLKNSQLVNGVSFASGGSGYDDLTAQLSVNTL